MSDEFEPAGQPRVATAADFVAAMTQANDLLIERDKRIAELEAALKPFAALGARMMAPDETGSQTMRIKVADVRAAQRALAE